VINFFTQASRAAHEANELTFTDPEVLLKTAGNISIKKRFYGKVTADILLIDQRLLANAWLRC
jgi:hypothetical protein